MTESGVVTLTEESRSVMIEKAKSAIRPGDVLFFYHRTSVRSRVIRRITRCEMPHVALYEGEGRVIGMLKGRVRRHRIDRFFKNEYDIRIVRGDAALIEVVSRQIDRRESYADLFLY